MNGNKQIEEGIASENRWNRAVRFARFRGWLVAYGPLIALTSVVILAYVLASFGHHAARSTNSRLIDAALNLDFEQPLSADPPLGLRSEVFLEDPCRVSLSPGCDSTGSGDSPMLARLRVTAKDASLRQRLAKKTYANAIELIQDLLDQRRYQSAASAIEDGFDGRSDDAVLLLDLAVNWSLTAALSYKVAGREQDAADQLAAFTDLSLPIVRKGYWVSASGVDVTDLPVLNAVFCSDSVQLATRRCEWGLLSAFAETLDSLGHVRTDVAYNADTVTAYDLSEWSAYPHGLDLSGAYSRQQSVFTTQILASYLNAIAQMKLRNPAAAHEILRTIPVFASRLQEALWFYQLGRSELLLSSWSPDAPVCERFKRDASVAFNRALQVDRQGLLGKPASARLLEARQLCANSK